MAYIAEIQEDIHRLKLELELLECTKSQVENDIQSTEQELRILEGMLQEYKLEDIMVTRFQGVKRKREQENLAEIEAKNEEQRVSKVKHDRFKRRRQDGH